jgi:hypothetical protein
MNTTIRELPLTFRAALYTSGNRILMALFAAMMVCILWMREMRKGTQ